MTNTVLAIIVCILSTIITTSVILFIIVNTLEIIYSNTQIDAVMTYVDGNNINFQKQIEEYSDSNRDSANDNGYTKNSKKHWRWSNCNEAKYSLLSIKRHAPFFRKIWLVMPDETHIPSWLNEVNTFSGPKIDIVYHYQFYKNTKHLPTFNSMSIEHNLHRIHDLTEHFVYFNDDCFIGKDLTKQDFLVNNKIVIGLEKGTTSPRGDYNISDIGFNSAWKNTNNLLDTLSSSTNREIIKHIPQIQRKSDHQKIIELFPEAYEKTSSSRFRNKHCNLMSAGLAEWYSIHNNTAIIDYSNDYVQAFVTDNYIQNEKNFEMLLKNKYKFINLQSSMTTNKNNTQFEQFMKDYFT